MAKYKVVAGKHFHREEDGSETCYKRGEVLELDAKEAARFTNKLQLVEESEQVSEGTPVTAGGGDGSTLQKSQPQPQPQPQPQAKTQSPTKK